MGDIVEVVTVESERAFRLRRGVSRFYSLPTRAIYGDDAPQLYMQL